MAKEDAAGKVSLLLAPYLEEKDLELYRAEYKKEGKEWVLRVFLDKPACSESEYVSIENGGNESCLFGKTANRFNIADQI